MKNHYISDEQMENIAVRDTALGAVLGAVATEAGNALMGHDVTGLARMGVDAVGFIVGATVGNRITEKRLNRHREKYPEPAPIQRVQRPFVPSDRVSPEEMYQADLPDDPFAF